MASMMSIRFVKHWRSLVEHSITIGRRLLAGGAPSYIRGDPNEAQRSGVGGKKGAFMGVRAADAHEEKESQGSGVDFSSPQRRLAVTDQNSQR